MISDEQWQNFFTAFRRTGILKTACEQSGIGRRTVYDHIAAAEAKEPTPEAQAWHAQYKEALLDVNDIIEAAMFSRAIDGVDEPLIGRVEKDKDGVVTTVKRYSDALLVRLAQARMPEKYKERVAKEISGPGGGPVQTETKIIAVPAIPDGSPE